MSLIDDPAISVCFTVQIDGYELGMFTGCSGIGAEIQVVQHEEGGNSLFVHQLPGRLKYSNIRLTRPLDGDSAKIAAWFSDTASNPTRATAEISACRADGTVVATWSLIDVIPVRWIGPELSAEHLGACIEMLELAHHGFLGGV